MAKFTPRAQDRPVQDEVPYHPPPSVGHEVGVIFGFIGFMLLCITLYGLGWQVANRRSQANERARIERLRSSGLLEHAGEKDGEKDGGGEGVRTEGL
ncbi:hypothetical protein BU24DRAFT_466062 [Aaosphaeria arxii CBS 175.79]|uniref:Uncharacterized protein n=1 Tax=Aaosphaeria arxii CBS 175.79 TaxID=1450172 RepID=A0A6A5XES8_9PLEO|nr:uncharacterized protein BU24DRAFT_466062 [Aaosphaeria arxii CBS 175.79]KAF2011346.1 hypothetical protein BU24DRAFT_466062 [Aaosphaeria arxii CBS 175.79]